LWWSIDDTKTTRKTIPKNPKNWREWVQKYVSPRKNESLAKIKLAKMAKWASNLQRPGSKIPKRAQDTKILKCEDVM